MKSLLLVDISNIYYCLREQYNARLSYELLIQYLAEKGYTLEKKIGYGINDDVHVPFQDFLKHLGFEVKTKVPTIKGADWDVGIAVDAMRYAKDFDAIIFATGDGDMAPCLGALKDQGKHIVVIGARVSNNLKTNSDEVFEITPSLFMKEVNANQNHN